MQLPKPHTPEWFESLEKNDPQQAARTRDILSQAGRTDVCSICGHESSNEYFIEHMTHVPTLRLCDPCLDIQQEITPRLIKKIVERVTRS